MSDTLEELWISYNNIEKMKGVTALSNLRVCARVWTYVGVYCEVAGVLSAGALYVQQQCQRLGRVPKVSRTPETSRSSVCR